jgi:hypothetical protein
MRLNNQCRIYAIRTGARTELGDKIASEKARTAKNGRDMPCYGAAPSRTIRDDRWLVRQGE